MLNLLPGILQIQIIILQKILGTESGFPLHYRSFKMVRESLGKKSSRFKKKKKSLNVTQKCQWEIEDTEKETSNVPKDNSG